MRYSLSEIANQIEGQILGKKEVGVLTDIVFDSRKVFYPDEQVFICLIGPKRDGHHYIQSAYNKGIRAFIVSQKVNIDNFPEAGFVWVDDTMTGLQKWARKHRENLQIPILAITGSNGKTSVKEYLKQLVSPYYNVYVSPGSYNSQLGVALSLLNIDSHHEMAIIEAGISQKGEMRKLQNMILPEYGILCNIGDAHAAGFESISQKLDEKLQLFESCETFVSSFDNPIIETQIKQKYPHKKLFSWGCHSSKTSRFRTNLDIDKLTIASEQGEEKYTVPSTEKHKIENLINAILGAKILGLSTENIASQTPMLDNVSMRLEVHDGLDGSLLIYDAYSADLQSFTAALDFLNTQASSRKKIIVLTDFVGHERDKIKLYHQVSNHLDKIELEEVVTLGENIELLSDFYNEKIQNFKSKKELIFYLKSMDLDHKAVLIKGARKYELETLLEELSYKKHSSTLKISLSAISQNIKIYQGYIPPDTDMIAVIKASAYGTGAIRLSKILQNQNIQRLAVAQIDEAIELRKAGITMDIMILNPNEDQLELCFEYNLEPEIYTIELLQRYLKLCENHKNSPGLHLKLDTGMHRLGIVENDLPLTIKLLQSQQKNNILSIMSHLAASENDQNDAFTYRQLRTFDRMTNMIEQELQSKFKKQILNSTGIVRFGNEAAYDMVRIGIGMYGIDMSGKISTKLQKAHTLYANVIQIKKVLKYETIGYGNKFVIDRDKTIAVLSIGYADGLMRKLGYGQWSVSYQGEYFPTIGAISMDMCTIDIGDYNLLKVGDEVEVFGPNASVEKMAEICETIPYEILSRLSDRIKRIFVSE